MAKSMRDKVEDKVEMGVHPEELYGELPDSTEHATAFDEAIFKGAIRTMLSSIGEDPDREGLQETPARVYRAYQELFSGYTTPVADLFKQFEDGSENYDEMIFVRDIAFTSFCEHHLLPFTGVVHVAYIPQGTIIGLSKIPRLVEVFAKRLQVQERLTTQIAEALNDGIKPKGVAVVVEAYHSCVSCRGVKKEGMEMATSKLIGVFKDSKKTRSEFQSLLCKHPSKRI